MTCIKTAISRNSSNFIKKHNIIFSENKLSLISNLRFFFINVCNFEDFSINFSTKIRKTPWKHPFYSFTKQYVNAISPRRFMISKQPVIEAWFYRNQYSIESLVHNCLRNFNPLSTNPKHWSNTLKKFVRNLDQNLEKILHQQLPALLKGSNCQKILKTYQKAYETIC